MRHARAATTGFVILLLLSLLSSLSDIFTMREIDRHQDHAREQALVLADIERLRFFLEKKVTASQAYLLTRDARFLSEVDSVHADFDSLLADIREAAVTEEGLRLLETIEQTEEEHHRALAAIIERSTGPAVTSQQIRLFLREMETIRGELIALMNAQAARKLELVRTENASAERFTARATVIAVALSSVLLLLGIGLAVFLARSIRERERSEQKLFEEIVEQNQETQVLIRELRQERDAARQRVDDLLSNRG